MRPSPGIVAAAMGFRHLLALLCAAAAVAVPAAAKPPLKSTGNGIEVPGTATWPAAAVRLAKDVAHASFAHDYARVWGYLHPKYQQAVSEPAWTRCQRAHPSAPPSVKITQVAIAQASNFPVALPLLGRQNLQEIQLLVRFSTSAAQGVQSAILYTFWLREGHDWHAVWLADEYQAYKSGKCYATPQGPPLY